MRYFEGPPLLAAAVRAAAMTGLLWGAASTLTAQQSSEPSPELPPAFESSPETVEEFAGPGTDAETSAGETQDPPVARQVEIVKAEMTTPEPQGPPSNRHLQSIRPFRRGAGRVDWSRL